MKKLLLIIALLISALGLNAQSVTIDDIEFTVTSETPAECEVSGYSGKPVDITIPSTVTISGKEFAVTSIGESAFYLCKSLTSIEFGENSQLTFIGDYAFYICSSLTSIEIPSGVTSIGEGAFYLCKSLTSIEIPSGVTSIGEGAFSYCSSLTSIEIPGGVTSIGEGAFSYCYSLTSIEIPSGVTSIGEDAFFYCSSLTSIIVENGNTVYDSRDNCNAIIETATNTLIVGCQNTVIPNTVSSIGEDAFFDCSSLTSIEIPSGVTSIGDNAFEVCSSLTSIEFGENSQLTFIGDYAFSGCSSLTSIEIPSGVTSIGEDAFSGCSSLTSIEFGENSQLTFIGDYAFYICSSLTSIEIPSGVTSIGDYAFSGCSSLTSIIVENGNTVYDSRDNCNAIIETATNTLIVGCQNTVIPNTVSFIGDWAFEGCSSLTSIEIPSGVTSIGEGAFYDCSSLTSMEIPSGVTSIGDWAFYGCSSLTSIEIPSGVTSIGDWAFYGCSSLTSIEIPSGVTSIGEDAFSGCSSLTSIYCYAETVPETSQYAFFGCPSNMVIYVPAQSVNDYNVTSPWKNYTIISLSCVVTASANPEDAGIITGAGEYTLNDTVTLTATANEGYKFLNWTENEEVVSEETEYSFTVTGDRNLVANFASTESIDELSSSFNLYPNPANDKLYIESKVKINEVTIYDVYGRQQELSAISGQQTVFDVTSLNNGIYFVKIVTDNGEVIKRFVKQ